MKQRVREITGRNGGRSLPTVIVELKAYLTGWKEYFRKAETPNVFADLDEWIRHRLRCLQLKQWKRGPTAYRAMRAVGASPDTAARVVANTGRWWANSALLLNSVLTTRYFDGLGVPRLASWPQPSEPPDADPHVRWCGMGAAVIYRRPLSR